MLRREICTMLDFIKENNAFRVSEQEEVSVSATEGMAVSRELEGNG